jgi:hypothetical protein
MKYILFLPALLIACSGGPSGGSAPSVAFSCDAMVGPWLGAGAAGIYHIEKKGAFYVLNPVRDGVHAIIARRSATCEGQDHLVVYLGNTRADATYVASEGVLYFADTQWRRPGP